MREKLVMLSVSFVIARVESDPTGVLEDFYSEEIFSMNAIAAVCIAVQPPWTKM